MHMAGGGGGNPRASCASPLGTPLSTHEQGQSETGCQLLHLADLLLIRVGELITIHLPDLCRTGCRQSTLLLLSSVLRKHRTMRWYLPLLLSLLALASRYISHFHSNAVMLAVSWTCLFLFKRSTLNRSLVALICLIFLLNITFKGFLQIART